MAETIVFLHGFTNTGASWDPVIAALGERYRALAPDLRGHGSAAAQRPISFDDCIEDLGALAPEAFSLVGYSMGGRIALQAALAPRLRARVQRLVTIGASPGIADQAERVARARADRELADEMEGSTIGEVVQRWGAHQLFADQPREIAAAADADRLRNDPAGLAAALRGLSSGVMPPVWERLGEIRVPTLLLAGERDVGYLTVARAMAASLNGARVAPIPGAGHAAHLEAPAAVAALIDEFVSA